MRPILVFAIACVILGGVRIFLDDANESVVSAAPRQTPEASVAKFDVELSLTFDAGPDAFALDANEMAPSLLVQLNGKEILRRTGPVNEAECPIVVSEVPNVTVGRNELYIEATPAETASVAGPVALRVRILNQGRVVADESLWSEFNSLIQGTVALEVSE